MIGPAGPEDDIQIQNPLAPSLPAATTELSFHGLQFRQQAWRIKMRGQNGGRICIAPAGGAHGIGRTNGRDGIEMEVPRQRLQATLDHTLRHCHAELATIRSERDEIAMGRLVGHGSTLVRPGFRYVQRGLASWAGEV